MNETRYFQAIPNAFLVLVLLTTTAAQAQMGDNEGETQPSLPSHVLNIASPVLSPTQAVDAFVLQEGFKIELVASEPMIEDPVAAVFAPDGSLWVIEMQSFMPDVDGNNEDEPISRVVTLRDLDGDGVMDTSTVFMDNLVLPRAIAMSHEGILLVAPPNLLYCRDTSGDGVCDDVQLLTDGFGGLDSIEHAGNGMLFGLDNTFHNSQHPFSFQFDGQSLTAISVPAHGQWGIAEDDYGRHYYTPNSYPVLIDEFPKKYARKRGQSRRIDGLYRGISTDKRVWPVHPTPGVNRGYQRGRLNEEYKLTNYDSACGPAVYRDTLFGEEFENNVFVCEAVGNLVSRFTIADDGNGSLQAVPAYDHEEFLASTDERFRPVNLINGPDGALYIVDMYRGIVQHRMFVTSFLREQIKARGLEKPLGLGRIWRVVPIETPTREIPDLSQLDAVALANHIDHVNGTIRDIAQRLLTESPHESAVPVLEVIATSAIRDRDRIKALWTLQGMGSLAKSLVLESMNDPHPMVRIHAVRLGEHWINNNDVFEKVKSLSSESNIYVQRQVALTAGQKQGPQAVFFLLKQLGTNSNKRYRSAAMAALMGREHEILDLISINATLKQDTPQNRTTLTSIVRQMLTEKNRSTNTLLIEFATKQAKGKSWQSEAVIQTIVEEQNGSQFKVARMPSRYMQLFQGTNEQLYESASKLHELIWWQGRTDIAEYIPKRVDQTTSNLITRGKKVYNSCKICHQVDGLGFPPTYPPLAGSEFVTDDAKRLIKIMLHGLDGPITVDGQLYDEYMPPTPVKNDYDIAAVITYVRQAWGNNASTVTPCDVKAVREQYKTRNAMWTPEELGQFK